MDAVVRAETSGDARRRLASPFGLSLHRGWRRLDVVKVKLLLRRLYPAIVAAMLIIQFKDLLFRGGTLAREALRRLVPRRFRRFSRFEIWDDCEIGRTGLNLRLTDGNFLFYLCDLGTAF